MKIEPNNIYLGDCLDVMKDIPDNTIDCVICDLPYGTTVCKWDVLIPFDKLWAEYYRICKPNAPIVLFGAEPFSSALRMSNLKEFRYDWIWEKTKFPNFMFVNQQPCRLHETISVFYRKQPTYNPQMEIGTPYKDKRTSRISQRGDDIGTLMGQTKKLPKDNKGDRFPSTVIRFSNVNSETLHPTQKPVDLLRYLILTYTNEGDTVLDNCMGSGTTCVAAIKEKRRYIGIEKDEKYFRIANKRIEQEKMQLNLF